MEMNDNLTEFQSDFLNSFFNTNSKLNHLLIAPTGSGKSIIIPKIIEKLYSTEAQKFLVITISKTQIDQYKMLFTQYIPDAILMTLTSKTYREYVAIEGKEENLLPNIIISTWENALIESHMQMIMSTKWDLIGVDAHLNVTTTKREKFLGKLLSITKSSRTIIVSDTASGNSFQKIANERMNAFKVTHWRLEKLLSRLLENPPIEISVCEYRRSDQEINFINVYMELSKKLPGNSLGNLLREQMVSSSLFAAEDYLRRYRNKLAHLHEEELDFDEVAHFQETSDNQKPSILSNDQFIRKNGQEIETDLTELLNNAFSSLEKIQVDSKFDALQTCLKEIKKSNTKIWICSRFQSTIKYLYTSLKENFPNIVLIHGGMSPSFINEAVSRFPSEGGILLSTNHMLEWSFIRFDKIFLYDIPSNQSLLYAILSRAITSKNYDSESPIELVMLKDLTDALHFENKNIQFVQHSLQSNLSN